MADYNDLFDKNEPTRGNRVRGGKHSKSYVMNGKRSGKHSPEKNTPPIDSERREFPSPQGRSFEGVERAQEQEKQTPIIFLQSEQKTAPKENEILPQVFPEWFQEESTVCEADDPFAQPEKKKRRGLRALLIILGVILGIGVVLAGLWYFFVKPPEITKHTNSDLIQEEQKEEVQTKKEKKKTEKKETVEETVESDRVDGIYTFALIGVDQIGVNTDTIMVARFDTNEHTMNIVSIPRDTLVNVSWSTKKINSLYGVGGTERLLEGLQDVLGFAVDFHVVVDLDAFKTLVDEIGGVWYEVPWNMDYDDPTQDLHIHVSEGYQCLNGEDAMGVVRFRGYNQGDIKRISIQQDFLKATAKQMMENIGSMSLSTLVSVFYNDVETDMSIGNLMWLAQEFFKMNLNKIQFMTAPGNYTDSVKGQSYVTLYVSDWLDMINTSLSPFKEPITVEDQDIYTRDEDTGRLYTTSGYYAGSESWGN